MTTATEPASVFDLVNGEHVMARKNDRSGLLPAVFLGTELHYREVGRPVTVAKVSFAPKFDMPWLRPVSDVERFVCEHRRKIGLVDGIEFAAAHFGTQPGIGQHLVDCGCSCRECRDILTAVDS